MGDLTISCASLGRQRGASREARPVRHLWAGLLLLVCDPDKGEPPNIAGPCAPAASDHECPDNYVCCSDDPATSQGRVPNYFQSDVVDDRYGEPLFSAANNNLSHSGLCVGVGAFSSPFPSGCAVPCNPTWDAATIAEICGTTQECCAFTEVDPNKDCVLDNGTWRAVSGNDIPALTNWGPNHTTNQDPDGSSCTILASRGGTLDPEALNDCIAQLTVADQRGFCLAPAECPCREDICAMKNPGYALRCTASAM